MELGISPLITSTMIVELFANAKLITYNASLGEDRKLLQSAEKLLSIAIAFGTAFAYVWSGMYGDVFTIGTMKALLIVSQLTIAGVIVLYIDEVMQKGYGIGSGISLFIAVNICENIIWRAISPITIKTENGIEFEGALIAFIHQIMTKQNTGMAIHTAFFRQNAPNLHNQFATIFIFFTVIYFQGFKVDIKLRSHQFRGAQKTFPIKLFYLSNTPIILQTALVSNQHFFSHILYKRFKGNPFIRIFGVWQEHDGHGGGPKVIGGLAYYLMPPNSIEDIFYHPSHFIIYLTFICGVCAQFSKLWLEISGRSPEDIVRSLKEGKLYIYQKKESSMMSVMGKYIPVAAVFGGICIGLLSVIADLLGAIGSGNFF